MIYTSQVVIYARETWDADPVPLTLGAYSLLRESCPKLLPFESLQSEDECQIEYTDALSSEASWNRYRIKVGSPLTYEEIRQIEGLEEEGT